MKEDNNTKNNETEECYFFGGCPRCGNSHNDGYLNVGRLHWFICHVHRVKWCRGENLFSSWRLESEVDWQENFNRLNHYIEVEPLMCKPE